MSHQKNNLQWMVYRLQLILLPVKLIHQVDQRPANIIEEWWWILKLSMKIALKFNYLKLMMKRSVVNLF